MTGDYPQSQTRNTKPYSRRWSPETEQQKIDAAMMARVRDLSQQAIQEQEDDIRLARMEEERNSFG